MRDCWIWDQMSDYKNVATVNNPLVYWPSFTGGQLIPDPLDSKAVPLRNQTASKSNGSGISSLVKYVYFTKLRPKENST